MEQIGSPARAAAATSISRDLYEFVTRLVDLAFSLTLLVLLSPVMAVIAVLVWLDSGLPIIYRSQRLGEDARPITVFKFRTMRDGSHDHLVQLLTADEELKLEYNVRRKLRRDPRRTRIGTFLRRTSLDELPQLLNVVRGEMTLIGPRPYFAAELVGVPEASEILSVRPGITGLWQVNGRSDRSFQDRIRLDLMYVRRHGFTLDFKIIVLTVRAVVSGRGAY